MPKAAVPPELKLDSLDELVSASETSLDVNTIVGREEMHFFQTHAWKMSFLRVPYRIITGINKTSRATMGLRSPAPALNALDLQTLHVAGLQKLSWRAFSPADTISGQ